SPAEAFGSCTFPPSSVTNEPSARRGPDAQRGVAAAADEALAVRGEAHLGDFPPVADLCRQLLAGVHRPHADAAVGAAGGEALSVRRERDTLHFAELGCEALEFLAGFHVPDADGAVAAARCHTLAVRRERRPHDSVGVALELAHLRTRLQNPKPQRP